MFFWGSTWWDPLGLFSGWLWNAAPDVRNFNLTASTDSGVLGDHVTDFETVSLSGQTRAWVTIRFDGQQNVRAQSDGAGDFTVSGLKLQEGTHSYSFSFTDEWGYTVYDSITLTYDPPAPTQMLFDWIRAGLDMIAQTNTDPDNAARSLAILNIAIHDAAAAIKGDHGVLAALKAGNGASLDAAIAGAAHRALVKLLPEGKAGFDALLQKQLARIDDAGESAGLSLGRATADTVIALRARDGHDADADYTPLNPPGADTPVPGHWSGEDESVQPLNPQWGGVTLFMQGSADPYDPGPPPALTSASYAEAFNEVKDWAPKIIAAENNPNHANYEEWQISKFWADKHNTYAPAGHWLQIAIEAAEREELSLDKAIEMNAQVSCAAADAGTVAWMSKYKYDFWRPAHAIWNADKDGNPLTEADPDWRPCVPTPPFPEYVSGHSTFSAAAATVLTEWFGADYSFDNSSLSLPGVTRHFDGFHQAAEEAGQSRIYGGVHFQFANQNGLDSGRKVGAATLERFAQTDDKRAPVVLLDNALENGDMRLRVFDDRAGVNALSVTTSGGDSIQFTPSARGLVTLDLDQLYGDDAGRKGMFLSVSDAAGNITRSRLALDAADDGHGGLDWSVAQSGGVTIVDGDNSGEWLI